MGNKYAKLLCAIMGIILLSSSQYQELHDYYQKELAYLQVQEYKKNNTKLPGAQELELDQLIATNRMKNHYSIEELKALAIDENDCYQETIAGSKKKTRIRNDETIIEGEEANLKIKARASALMDADSGRILYGENVDKELAMASTTKIMTCIVALEHGYLDDVVTASKNAAKMPDVQLNMVEGEQFYLKDLLYSLMLESHNDSAVAIAEHISGSVEGFADLMNAKAKELGLSHTRFVTPNGLDAEGHYTTARELGKLASYAIRNECLLEIINTKTHEFKELTKDKTYVVNNKNRFLYMMDGAIGVKTGFTNNAGYCFVGALKRDNRTFVTVVLGSGWPPHKTYKWEDTVALMNYGINNFQKKILINKKVTFENLIVEDGRIASINAFSEGSLSAMLRKDEEVKVIYEISDTLKAPIRSGEQIGKMTFLVNGIIFYELPIYSENSVKKMDYKYCLTKTLDGLLWMRH